MTEQDFEQIRVIVRNALADDLAEIKRELAATKAEQAEQHRAIDMLLQDTQFIHGAVGGHTRTLDILLQDVRMLRSAVNDARPGLAR